MSGAAMCASVSKAVEIYDFNSAPFDTWEGPLDCQGEYCVYSNRAISKHPWAILATTPEAAQSLASHFHIVPNDQPVSGSPPYQVSDLPGKGRGLVANRMIYKGQRIIAEDAILALHTGAHLQLPPDRRSHLYDLILENLPPEARAEFLSQAGEDVTTIIDRNGFNIHTERDSDAVSYVGAFPEQALINHDCRPNLAYNFCGVTHITTAMRDIQPGEELTLSYIDLTLPIRQRHVRLAALWNFSCNCRQCQLPYHEADASDTRLKRIKVLEDAMDHPATSFPAGDLDPHAGSQLVTLYEQERLDVYIGYAYRRAALNYALFADEQNAQTFAQKALKALEWQGGPEQKDLENMRGLLTEPKMHWSWGRLAGQSKKSRV
ncbi:hypothetical protein Daus18300_009661 [Diaporthe australafricana]|uniref:SET domain-containing protein n=1 Tax=Diaporthe australafricana TaxID=127596 RepID=A0ABR3WD49_9PEZI